MPDPKEEMRRQLEFDELPSRNIDKEPGQLANEVFSSKREQPAGKQPKNRPRAKALGRRPA